MPTQVKIIGIHPVDAREPVHLIEIFVGGDVKNFDFGQVTQEVPGRPRQNWQAPWDERLLEEFEGEARYAFFFHYLDLMQPLLTPAGPVPLLKPTAIPGHLQFIEYESP